MTERSGQTLELSGSLMGFRAMTGSTAAMVTKRRIRVVLLILVAVVVSMTLHHGAMARSISTPHTHATSHHNTGDECAGTCVPERHSMPVCCGMGLCLSGLPAAPLAVLMIEAPAARFPILSADRARWATVRIDRPPKDFLHSA